jgi:hypothetical protein
MNEALPALTVFVTLIALSGFLTYLSLRFRSFFAGFLAVAAFLIALAPDIPGVTV